MGGGSKTPDLPPAPAPTPVPTPTKVDTVETELQRSNRMLNLKKGMLSTMKTNVGMTGAGVDLSSAPGGGAKRTLGGA